MPAAIEVTFSVPVPVLWIVTASGAVGQPGCWVPKSSEAGPASIWGAVMVNSLDEASTGVPSQASEIRTWAWVVDTNGTVHS